MLCALGLLAAACSPAAPVPATTAATITTAATGTPTPVPTPTPVSTPGLSGKVTMGDNYFAPDEITVAVGATVTWEIVAGDAKHDVVAADGSFRSNSPMNRGDLFTFTFTKAGEYAYICSFHTVEHMTGKIVVK